MGGFDLGVWGERFEAGGVGACWEQLLEVLLGLGAEGWWKGGDGLGDVVAFFLPAGDHRLVAGKFYRVGDG